MEKIRINLSRLEKQPALSEGNQAARRRILMEFHINRDVRREYDLKDSLFSLTGNVVFTDMKQVRELTAKFNSKQDPAHPQRFIKAGQLYAMGLIDEIMHYVVALYREQIQADVFETALNRLEKKLGDDNTGSLLTVFSEQFPPRPVYKGEKKIDKGKGNSVPQAITRLVTTSFIRGTENAEILRDRLSCLLLIGYWFAGALSATAPLL